MRRKNKTGGQPPLEIALQLPVQRALDFDCSFVSISDADEVIADLVDVLGSTFAEAAGWRPIGQEDIDDPT